MFADIHHYVAMRYTNSAPGHPPSTIPATGSTPPCLDIPLTSPQNRNSAAATPPQLDTVGSHTLNFRSLCNTTSGRGGACDCEGRSLLAAMEFCGRCTTVMPNHIARQRLSVVCGWLGELKRVDRSGGRGAGCGETWRDHGCGAGHGYLDFARS